MSHDPSEYNDRVAEKRRDLLDEAMDNFDLDRLAETLEAMHEDISELGDLANTIKRRARGDIASYGELGELFYALVREYAARNEATLDYAADAVSEDDEARRTKTPWYERP